MIVARRLANKAKGKRFSIQLKFSYCKMNLFVLHRGKTGCKMKEGMPSKKTYLKMMMRLRGRLRI